MSNLAWWPASSASTFMAHVLAQARQWASSDLTILLLGETGTGKSMLARQIHGWSSRTEGPFVEVDCGAVPDSLVEREFFGSEKGAFTGATGKSDGRFMAANHGTLLLDDVQNLSPRAQTCVLGVFDTQTICPIGTTKRIKLNLRTVATSNQNLLEMAHDHRFRTDLYYRLNHVVLTLIPLRERPDDIVPLAARWLAHLADTYHQPYRCLSAVSQHTLRNYAWPGNLRELSACLNRAILCSAQHEIEPGDLFGASGPTPSVQHTSSFDPTLPFPSYTTFRTETDHQYCQAALDRASGCVERAAALAGLSRATFYRIVARLGLTPH